MQIPLSEAKSRLYELVRKVEHEEVVILRHGRPAAVMVCPKRLEALLDDFEDLEDKIAFLEAREIPRDQYIPWEKVKIELGLD